MFNGGKKSLFTTLDEGSGSFGVMFDIFAKNRVEVTHLSIHTDSTSMIKYEIYVKDGSYVGYEDSPEVWEQISSGEITGRGSGVMTMLPSASFKNVEIMPNQSMSFYVTLLTYDLRYSVGKKEGDIYVENDDILLLEGAGIAQYKFGMTQFRPRVFNGVVHYDIVKTDAPTVLKTSTPSAQPTMHITDSPTNSPTQDPTKISLTISESESKPQKISLGSASMDNLDEAREITVDYYLVVDHPKEYEISDLLENAEYAVTTTLQDILKRKENKVVGLRGQGKVFIITTEAAVDNSNEKMNQCIPSRLQNVCTPLRCSVEVSYSAMSDPETGELKEILSDKEVEFELLGYVKDITEAVWGSKYLGAHPVSTSTVITLSGDNLKPMEDGSHDYFESVVKNFLNNVFQMTSLEIYDVKINKQTINVDVSLRRALRGRDHDDARGPQHNMNPGGMNVTSEAYSLYADAVDGMTGSSLDITTTVTGEYTPPPSLTLDTLVDESFQNSGEYFVEELKENEQFENVDKAVSRSLSLSNHMIPTSKPTIFNGLEIQLEESEMFEKEENSAGLKKSFTITLSSLVVLAFVFFVGFFMFRKTKKRKDSSRLSKILKTREASLRDFAENKTSYRDLLQNRDGSQPVRYSLSSQ